MQIKDGAFHEAIESALELRGLTKRFDRLAVDALDLTVRSGEFYVLVGPNGAGKTTTLRMVAGLLPPDAGTVAVFGIDALADPVPQSRLMAWVSDEPMIYDKLTPLEYLEFVAGLWGIDPGVSEPAAHELLVSLGLQAHLMNAARDFPRACARRSRWRARWCTRPRLIILDEPLTGLDAVSARHVKGLLNDRVRAGCTVIMTTHILEVAERMADRIGVIAAERLVAEGTLAELRQQNGQHDTSLEDLFIALVDVGGGRMSSATALAWFARHEFRLAWREWLAVMTAGRRGRKRAALIGVVVFAAIMHLPAYAVIGRFADLQLPPDISSLIIITATIFLAWTLMLSQAIESVTRVFYARADLDLIMSSPVQLTDVFSIRIAAIALSVTAMSLLLSTPFVDVLVIGGGLRWLAAYGVSSRSAFRRPRSRSRSRLLLFRMIGPRRTRLAAQIIAAIIGAGFVIALQIAAILSYGTLSRFAILTSDAAAAFAPDLESVLWWPARAALGDKEALAVLLAGRPRAARRRHGDVVASVLRR